MFLRGKPRCSIGTGRLAYEIIFVSIFIGGTDKQLGQSPPSKRFGNKGVLDDQGISAQEI